MNITDQLNNTPSSEAVRVAFGVVDQLQHIKPGVQVAAVAMLFSMLCTRYKARPMATFEQAIARVNDELAVGRGEHVRALREYLKGEL